MVRQNRRRYVVFHVLQPDDVGKGLLIKLIRDMTRKLPQEEFDRIKPWFVYYKNKWCIVRTGHTGVERLIRMIESLDGLELREGVLMLRVTGVSGTLRGAFHKHIPEKGRQGLHYRAED